MSHAVVGQRIALVATVAMLGSSQLALAAVANYYWTDRDAATLNKTTAANVTTQLVPPGSGRLQDVDLGAGGMLYFSDWGPVGPPDGEGKINKVSTSGGLVTNVLTTNDGVHQLALDEPQIYYTQGVSYSTRAVGVVNTDGTSPLIVHTEPSWFASGIAVDSSLGLIYWGDIGVVGGFPYDGTVNVSTTGGAGAANLEPHLNGRGRGFYLYNGEIYLTAHDPTSPATNGAIYKYTISTDTLTTLIPTEATGKWDIQIDEGAAPPRMYWTDYAAGTIESALLDGTDRQVELSGLSHPYGLALEFAQGVPASNWTGLLLLAIGFAATLGFWLWRRNSATTPQLG